MEIVKIDKRLCEGQNGNYHYEIGPQLHYRSFHSSYTQTFRLSNHICESVDHADSITLRKAFMGQLPAFWKQLEG